MSLPLKVNPATLNLSYLTVHRAVLQFLRARWCEGAVVAAILYIKPQPQLSEGYSFQSSRPRDVDKSTSDPTYMLSALRTSRQPLSFTPESYGKYSYRTAHHSLTRSDCEKRLSIPTWLSGVRLWSINWPLCHTLLLDYRWGFFVWLQDRSHTMQNLRPRSRTLSTQSYATY
jgi:hypothetical protein